MKVTISRQDDAFLLESRTEDGFLAFTDAGPATGGHNQAMRPMQLLLSSMGSCSLIDVIFLLNKQRQPLEHVDLELNGERRDEEPRIFTKIHLKYRCYGELDEKKVERACRLSMEKMCSISLMLKATVDISWEYEILPGKNK